MNPKMTTKLFPILALSVATVPAMAIEPPVDRAPIPPQQPPATIENAPPRRVQAAPRAVEVAEPEALQAGKPYLGVVLENVPEFLAEHLKLENGQGVIIGQILEGGPAATAGLEKNDIILKLDGKPIGARQDISDITAGRAVGDEVLIEAIQGGEHREFKVVLGARPQAPDVAPLRDPGFGMADRGLNSLPDRHADLLRDALQRNLQLLDQFDETMPDIDQAFPNHMMERLRRQMSMGSEGMQFRSDGMGSSIRLMDENGSVELNNDGSGKQAKVFGPDGKVVWEGPYETEEDKAAAPEDVRQRIDSLDFGSSLESFGDGGIRLRFQGGRFRDAGEVAPEVAPPAPAEDAPAGD